MSSTNRSDARNQHIADYYVTPVPEIEKFLQEFEKIYGYHLWHGKILDPCAGGDEHHDMSYPVCLEKYNRNHIDTIDIRHDSRAETIGDYLQLDCKDKYDLIITNPPFNIALPIITKALQEVKAGGDSGNASPVKLLRQQRTQTFLGQAYARILLCTS